MESKSAMESQLQQQGDKYFLGEKSKVANWVLNHPFHIATGGTLFSVIIAIGDNTMLIRVLQTLPLFYFGYALLVRLLCRNLCYLVQIDTKSDKIIFFRCFNKGIVEAPIQSVSFLFDIHFAAIYAGKRFTIFNGYMAEIAELVQPEKEIKFSQGIYGRFMRWQCERNRQNLKVKRGQPIN